jgi:hypothetical protein
MGTSFCVVDGFVLRLSADGRETQQSRRQAVGSEEQTTALAKRRLGTVSSTEARTEKQT